jgi:hypothetical protein
MLNDSPLIPIRRPISGLMADNVAQVMFNRLIAEWGLNNAEQIGAALVSSWGMKLIGGRNCEPYRTGS